MAFPHASTTFDDERVLERHEHGVVRAGVVMLLGAWLVITPFLWPHAHATAVNAWLTGALLGAGAICALYVPAVKFVDALLAIWLLASAFLLPHVSVATIWNDALVAVAVLVSSLLPHRGAR